MKGIILAGGSGSRLYPITKGVSKQLLPVYDKPMVYYPLATLMQAQIRDVLLITTPQDSPQFQRLLGDGSDFGIRISYAVQPTPAGLAQAFIIGRDFIGDDAVCMVLGDNIFHGPNFGELLLRAARSAEEDNEASVFGYHVEDPERYGVAEFDDSGKCISIEEKPECPKSKYAVTGIYFYPSDVTRKATMIKPSARGELEITDLNNLYLTEGRLRFTALPKGFAWLDTGTYDSLADASIYIEVLEKRQGLKIGCLEVIAYELGWIDTDKLLSLGEAMKGNEYGQYLLKTGSQNLPQ